MQRQPASRVVPDGIHVHRMRGSHSLVGAVDAIARAIAACRESGATRLLVDVTGVEDVPVPTLIDRFLMIEDWAQAAQGMVVVAMVAPARYIHPRKFGVHVAAHLGLACDVYTTEAEAVAWLSAATGATDRDAGRPAQS